MTAIPGSDGFLQCRVDGVVAGPGGFIVEDKFRSGTSMQAADLRNECLQGFQITSEIWSHWKATDDLLPVMIRSTRKPAPRDLKAAQEKGTLDGFLDAHFLKENTTVELVAERTLDQLAGRAS